jgi:hypothetical protein
MTTNRSTTKKFFHLNKKYCKCFNDDDDNLNFEMKIKKIELGIVFGLNVQWKPLK